MRPRPRVASTLDCRARARFAAALASGLCTGLAAAVLAQPPAEQQPLPVWAQPQQPPAAPQRVPPAPPDSPVIARIGDRSITQLDFDRIAQPYFQMLRSQFGDRLEEVRAIANFNVLDELLRRALLAIEVERRGITPTPEEVDALLRQDPFFLTNGKFDPVKFSQYKTSPGSNYLQMLPRLREMAAMKRLDEMLRRGFKPTAAQVRAEWAKRNDQVRFKVLHLATRSMPLEPEATEAEWAEHYQAHPDQFLRRTRVRLRYARLPIPAEGDSARAPELAVALERARALSDSLRQGALPDTAASLLDTGLFDISAPSIPGLGRVPELSDALKRAEEDSTVRLIGPSATRDAVIVGVIVERQPAHVPPMREILADVKRRADAEKRRVADAADRRAFHAAHQERWQAPRVSLTRVTLHPSAVAAKPPPAKEVERWYAQHSRSLFDLPDTSQAWVPPITDSLRTVVRARMTEADRARRLAETLSRIAAGLRASRDPRTLARANGAMAETLSLSKAVGPDTLFGAGLTDSLLAGAAAARGAVQGPRALGTTWALWRIDAVDTSFVPPYEVVKARVDQEFAEERRRQDEAEAREYFEGHRGEFRTPVKYALDVVAVAIPPPDSVTVPEAETRRHYQVNRERYRQEEQLHARHILFTARDQDPQAAGEAKARADSLLAAIRNGGADFVDLARRFSQEPGASESGGDLGWFGRGRMVREFEEAAFALQPGEISPVVKSQFGYHIIRLEDRKPAGFRPFDEVRGEIHTQLAQALADTTARRAANALRRRLAQGADAGTLATPHGGVTAAGPIAANDPLPGIGSAPGLAQDLPAMAVGRWASKTYRAGNRYLVLRLREKLAERPAEFDEVKGQALEAVRNAKRRAALAAKVEAMRAALAAEASLDSLAAPYGGLRDSGLLGQAASFVPLLGNEPRVVQKAFAMQPGEMSDTLEVAQGVAWIRVEEKKSGDPDTFKAEAAQIEAELTKQRYDGWVEARKRTLKIEILRADLRGPRPSPAGSVTVSRGG